MCGISPKDLCKWSEALPVHIGFTKQLVFRVALPHITLLLISIFYALFGCVVLSAFDYNGFADGHRWENRTKLFENNLKTLKKHFVSTVINGANTTTLGSSEFNKQFKFFASNLYHIYEQQQFLNDRSPNLKWNLFFSTTWLASIGYGKNAPRTIGRRIFCMFYLTFGIPLYLVTLADLAKFCTEAINRFYTECIQIHFKFRQSYRRRNAINICKSESDDVILVQPIDRRKRSKQIRKSLLQKNEHEMAEFLWKYLEKTQFVEVPFALVYLLLLGYIIFASYIVAYMENWSIWDGIYFIIMSVLTIGFGDIVPKNPNFILVILFVIIIGLIVTTTFIDMVGAYYIDRLHFVGRRMDIDDPLEWLKAVQQRRIEAMKREAMRHLFETVTAMWHFRVFAPPRPPLADQSAYSPSTEQRVNENLPPPIGIAAFHVTADSVTLKWEPPLKILLTGQKFWYTLSIKPRTPQKLNTLKVIDFIRQNRYVIHGLNSMTATITWNSPKKNHGPEQYFLLFAQEPAPQFQYWRRFEIGKNKRFTLTDLSPDTRYVVCVFAAHNFGFAAMSRTLRFKTRSWWFQDDVLPTLPSKGSIFLAPPLLSAAHATKARRPSLREPTICEGNGDDDHADTSTHKSSLQSGEYQDTT
ncbi:hypothetical protein niasHS_013661 [Heterodera schachtii]|uniref:Fibronectin type-III domain-containing protein n=1 Tax=Heterodera schachtii TaxID=97005 RepID=A0ABD2IGF8_HETSC